MFRTTMLMIFMALSNFAYCEFKAVIFESQLAKAEKNLSESVKQVDGNGKRIVNPVIQVASALIHVRTGIMASRVKTQEDLAQILSYLEKKEVSANLKLTIIAAIEIEIKRGKIIKLIDASNYQQTKEKVLRNLIYMANNPGDMNPDIIRVFHTNLDYIRNERSPNIGVLADKINREYFINSNKIKDPCESVCELYSSANKWLGDTTMKYYFYTRTSNASTSSAYFSIGALFLLKAQKYCDPKNEKNIIDRDAFIENLTMSEADLKDHSCKVVGLTNFTDSNLNTFLSNVKVIYSRIKPFNSEEYFSNVFFMKVLEELNQDAQDITVKSKLNKRKKIIHTRITSDMNNYTQLRRGLTRSSLMTNYSMSVGAEAVDSPKNSVYRYLKSDFKGSLNFAYAPGEVSLSKTGRGSAGRAVPAAFTLWDREKKDNPKWQESKRYKKLETDLFDTLENFDELIPSFAGVLNSNSAHVGLDGIAPYYLYSNIPYATSSIERLLRESKHLTDTQKNKLKKMRDNILRLSTILIKNGITRKDNSNRANSHKYNNPLFGLSLLPFCKKAKDLGITEH